jgi:hypothetical protein
MGNLGSSRLPEHVNRLSTDKSTVADVTQELYAQEYSAKVAVFSFSLILDEIIVERVVSAGEGHLEFRIM